MKEKYTINQLRNMKMTDAEKQSVWDGVLRRTTDYPEGEYPFEQQPNNWDGVLRRKSDFPDGAYPGDSLDDPSSSLISQHASHFNTVRKDGVYRLPIGGWMIPLGERYAITGRKKIFTVASMLIVVLSVGTSAFAHNALPGNPLYSIKVNVNEQVEKLFALTPEDKARVEGEFAIRRLDEAHALAQKDMLTPSLEEELDTRFRRHSSNFEMYLTTFPPTGPVTDADILPKEGSAAPSATGTVRGNAGVTSKPVTATSSTKKKSEVKTYVATTTPQGEANQVVHTTDNSSVVVRTSGSSTVKIQTTNDNGSIQNSVQVSAQSGGNISVPGTSGGN